MEEPRQLLLPGFSRFLVGLLLAATAGLSVGWDPVGSDVVDRASTDGRWCGAVLAVCGPLVSSGAHRGCASRSSFDARFCALDVRFFDPRPSAR